MLSERPAVSVHGAARAKFVAPSGELEVLIASAYGLMLGLAADAPVSAAASFFELGGNSLTAVRLVHMLREELSSSSSSSSSAVSSLGLTVVFEHPTAPRR